MISTPRRSNGPATGIDVRGGLMVRSGLHRLDILDFTWSRPSESQATNRELDVP